MRPWTVICIKDDNTKAVDMPAPYDYAAAKAYIAKECDGKVLAIIPGSHATQVSLFNDKV